MTFKPAIWYPIAVVLSALNLVGVGFAVGPGEPWHAGVHAALALAFGLWAQRLRLGRGGSDLRAQLEGLEAEVSRLDALEADMNKLRQQVSEAHERLDFAERLLARGPDARRVDPQR
jgi:hypothetical protein